MNKSTITREQLTEELKRRISVTERYPDLETAQIDAIICKMALAAMNSDPVAYTDAEELESLEGVDGHSYAHLWPNAYGFGKDIPLYTVPQIMLSPVGQEPLEWN
ncbi:hypothetical protein [Klebsiella aerogenes]|uniref:hypothetical protein n=1 Tax=Klebsiella aerogenes TaxID=548 RepID=UPI00115A280A|nr:hypothetical protein [Klebsiella aerogenes]